MMTEILEAIKCICGDICEIRDADDTRKRAEAISCLTLANMFLPNDQEENLEDAGQDAGLSAALPGA